MACIVVASGAQPQVVAVDRLPITVGRADDNTIVLDVPEVSRHHCRIERWPGGIHGLEDLGSTNGTVLNGQCVSRSVLESEDRIFVGPALLVYLDEGVSVTQYLGTLKPRDAQTPPTAELIPWRPSPSSPGLPGPPMRAKPTQQTAGQRPRSLTPTEPELTVGTIEARNATYLRELLARLSQQVPLIADGEDLGRLMATILVELARWTGYERSQLLLLDDATGRLVSVLGHQVAYGGNSDQERLRIEERVRRCIAEQGGSASVVQRRADERSATAPAQGVEPPVDDAYPNNLCLPLTVPLRPGGPERRHPRPRAIGAIYLDGRRPVRDLRAEELEVVHAIAALAATSLQTARLRHESITDPMTRLHNRRTVWQVLDSETERAVAERERIGVILVDLDGLKSINDTWGHGTGDEVLMRVGLRIRRATREEDLVARWGGDEFVVVLLEPVVEQIQQVAERIRRSIVDRPIGERQFRVSASLGVAWVPEHDGTGAELVQRADEALYRAKEHGRNRVEVAEPLPSSTSR